MKLFLVVILVVIVFSVLLWFVLSKLLYKNLATREKAYEMARKERDKATQAKVELFSLKIKRDEMKLRIKMLEDSLQDRAENKEMQDELIKIENLIKEIEKEI